MLYSGKARVTELWQPIQHLVPLELLMSPYTQSMVPRASASACDDENETRRRPRRTAAVVGELLRKGMS